MTREFICILCPYGCGLTVELTGTEIQGISGNRCERGRQYARQEAIRPMRVITSLMRSQDRAKPFSVKTDIPIPKTCFFDCVNLIRQTRPKAPIHCGDIILRNILDTGANVVATQDVD
jgi:CxxC motif-containing protein